jgi:hypothetical protein
MNAINTHNLQDQFLNFHVLEVTFHVYIFNSSVFVRNFRWIRMAQFIQWRGT